MAKAEFGPAGNSVSFYESGHKATHQVFAWLKNKGLDAYEYQGGKGIFASEKTLAEIGEEAKAHNIKISLHAPYYISLSSVEDEKRINSIRYITQSASAADLLGADIFVVHSGSAARMDREDAMRKAEDTLYKAAEAMEEGGFSSKAGLETMGKLNQLGTLDEVIRLCKVNTKYFRPVVDFGHINARSLGKLTAEDDFKHIFDEIGKQLGADAAENLHCHFSKIEYTKMGEKKHLTFADETFGPSFELFINAVASLGVAPRVICESDGTMTEDALTMKMYYEKVNRR